MSNKRFSDVRPNRDDKDSSVPAKTASGKTMPKSDPTKESCKAPTHSRGPIPTKGGHDLPVPSFKEQLHNEPDAPLPKSV